MDMYEPYRRTGQTFTDYFATLRASEAALQVPQADQTSEDNAWKKFERELRGKV